MGRSVSTPYGAQLVAYDHIEYEDEYDDWSYDHFVDMLRERIAELWPSMGEADGWLGREDRVLMENQHAKVGMSEYCGLVAIWVVPAEDSNLSVHWVDMVAEKFNKNFGSLNRIGVASNGEAFFERRAG